MLTEEDKNRVFAAICDGDLESVVALVTRARDEGDDLALLVKDTMIPAMAEVGVLFSAGEIFVPEMLVPEMLVPARAMLGGIDLIEPVLAATDHQPLARVCSVKGDMHEIGKNLVMMMLRGEGFPVEDLGADVSKEGFSAACNRGNAVACQSALLTTTREAADDHRAAPWRP